MKHTVGAGKRSGERSRIAGNIDLTQREARVRARVVQVDRAAGGKVIDHHNLVAACEQRIGEMAADESGSAGNHVT